MNKSFVFAACLFGQVAAAQTTVDIPIDQARVIATRALFAGDVELALQIARGLLEINPDDRAALVVVAAGAPRTGAATEGRRAGARAYAVSQSDAQRYEAARLTALAAANEERYTLTTFWLRRALTVVPNDDERTKTIRDATRIQRLNPWSTNLSFSIVPSNNVNGGAEKNKVEDLDGLAGNLSADALALKGVRATLNFGTSYRFYESSKDRAAISFAYQGARVRLDDETAEDPSTGAPVELDSADFSSDYLQVSLNYDRVLNNGTMGIAASLGSFDFGGDPYYDFRRFSLSRAIPLTDPTTLFLSANREWQKFDNELIGETMRTTVRTSLSYRFASGDRMTGTISHVDSIGDQTSQTFDSLSFEYRYNKADPIGPVSIGLSAGVKYTDYPAFILSSEGRQDDSVFYGIDLGFPDIEYAGFSPGLSINGGRSESNIGRFTRNNLSVALTINSAF